MLLLVSYGLMERHLQRRARVLTEILRCSARSSQNARNSATVQSSAARGVAIGLRSVEAIAGTQREDQRLKIERRHVGCAHGPLDRCSGNDDDAALTHVSPREFQEQLNRCFRFQWYHLSEISVLIKLQSGRFTEDFGRPVEASGSGGSLMVGRGRRVMGIGDGSNGPSDAGSGSFLKPSGPRKGR